MTMDDPELPPEEVYAWRKRARETLIQWRQDLPLEEHAAASSAVFRWVEDVFLQQLKGLTVGLYFPFKRELDPLPFGERLRAVGAMTAMPVVVERGAPLKFRGWAPGDPLAKGVWDIPYPAEGRFVEPEALIVSLVAFDGGGYRLGYGGGYYDRTLARYRRPITIGVGFEDTRLQTIHPQDHDIPMDFIVTEDGLFQRAESVV
jgi:5-formyltetrahydrofolate cyclo-ligase